MSRIGFPRLKKRSECDRSFDFEYDTGVIALAGGYWRILVSVYDFEDIELLDMETGNPVSLIALPRKDQLNIHRFVDERIHESSGYSESDFGNDQERRAEIIEMNSIRRLR